MKIPKGLDISIRKIENDLLELLNEQSEFEEVWRSMVKYILPARGQFIQDAHPKKRNLVSKSIMNNAGKEAAEVLAAALQSGLTPANSQWIELDWEDEEPKNVEFLQKWLKDVAKITLAQLSDTNFYDATYMYYMDLSVICNAAIHSGEGKDTALVFDNYAVGEYVFQMSPDGKPDPFIQVRWLKLKTIIEMYGAEKLPENINKDSDSDLSLYYPVVKAVYKKEHRGKPYVSIHYIRGANGSAQNFDMEDSVLAIRTYDDCPNHIGRWSIVSNENLALGPGFDGLPHVRRLQEQERTYSMMAHKQADPPVNIPAELRNKANLLPGGENYLRGDRAIRPIYDRQGSLNDILLSIERTEERIAKVWYNDVFLTSSRDPNASPLRTGEVNQRSQESLIKLGPVVGRIFTQTLKPMIERCINILAKNGHFPDVPPEFQQYVGQFNIKLVSPLAQSMKLLEGRAVQSFLQNLAGAANFYPEVLDKINPDKLVDKFAEVTSIPLDILRSQEEVDDVREQRAAQLKAQKDQENALIQQQSAQSANESRATVAKNLSSAGAQVSDIAKEGPIG